MSYFHFALLVIGLLILIFFFTTPAILLATIDEITVVLANLTTINVSCVTEWYNV